MTLNVATVFPNTHDSHSEFLLVGFAQDREIIYTQFYAYTLVSFFFFKPFFFCQ